VITRRHHIRPEARQPRKELNLAKVLRPTPISNILKLLLFHELCKYIHKPIKSAIIADMKRMIAPEVIRMIENLPESTIFGLKDFAELGSPQAVLLALSRLRKSGRISRLAKGKYYVPRRTKYGELQPEEWKILDQIVKENGGYFAGNTALNRIGVTTQVPSVISIRGARSTRQLKIGSLTVNLVRQGNTRAKSKDAELTDILEVLRLIRRTPDGNIAKSLMRVRSVLGSRSKIEKKRLVNLAKDERPYVRALLGAVMQRYDRQLSAQLKETLNPITRYRLSISSDILPNKMEWGID